MTTSGWTRTLLLLLLLNLSGSAAPAHAPAAPFLSQIPAPPLPGSEQDRCPLKTSPSALVVRFGDPASVNCSVSRDGFYLLGWEVSLAQPEPTNQRFLVWSVDRMTKWGVQPKCFALSDLQEQCYLNLPVVVYKPPEKVSLSFVNHTGPLLEGRRYALQCHVQDVAPVENLTVTFYRGAAALGSLQTRNCAATPVSEVFTLTVTPRGDDHGAQYWCEAVLELGPHGPPRPPTVTSEKLTAAVLFGPRLTCPSRMQVREGERLRCEVTGNPPPSVTWYRNGEAVVLPARSSREHAGKYTALARGALELKNFTVEVEVLGGHGSANVCDGYFLLAVALGYALIWM